MKTNTHINLRKEGDKFFKLGQYQEAIDKYQEALEYKINYCTGYLHLAKALLAQGQYDDAISYCEKALKIKGNYVYAYRIKGDAHKLKAGEYFKSNDLDKLEMEYATAASCYTSAIELSGNNYPIGEHCLSTLELLKAKILVNNDTDKEEAAKNSIAAIDKDKKSTIAAPDEEDKFDPEELQEVEEAIIRGDVKAVKATIIGLNGDISTKESDSHDSHENSLDNIKQKKSADEDITLKEDKLPIINKEHLTADKWGNCELSEAIADGDITKVREMYKIKEDLSDANLLKKIAIDMMNMTIQQEYQFTPEVFSTIYSEAKDQLKLMGENIDIVIDAYNSDL